ncbi:uncharacterized protein VICG_01625 [Vittaforma corneae ATCC 50505]|uniref:Sas10 C-terminal domain-containing protein n=1 Tax=Vittaforma corneae (strain ATCC 50505) TaxID=993615 RepID=L2GL64_VITCO|nr:uncharacterized protein VICG_01625 [Vittaforma corneae ATCC 50505]ELA41384.1 hypothetical protein VICG_01625 [Vittaforma corneae ATCC 50505]
MLTPALGFLALSCAVEMALLLGFLCSAVKFLLFAGPCTQMKAKESVLSPVETAVQELSKATNECKVELLRHYLLNYILYLELPSDEAEDSPIKEKLLKISVLLDKVNSMEKNAEKVSGDRTVDEKMMKNKPKACHLKSKNPRKKFKINSEKLKERTKAKDDYNIDTRNGRSSKFG